VAREALLAPLQPAVVLTANPPITPSGSLTSLSCTRARVVASSAPHLSSPPTYYTSIKKTKKIKRASRQS